MIDIVKIWREKNNFAKFILFNSALINRLKSPKYANFCNLTSYFSPALGLKFHTFTLTLV